ncbi:MAG: hypothetical protein QXU69_07115 [Thermofilaceae archaeon]
MKKWVVAFILLLAAAVYLAYDTWGELIPGVPNLIIYIAVLGGLVYIYLARIKPELEVMVP